MSRPPLEVADVVRQHSDAFLQRYGASLSGAQHRALRAIAMCRTAALGGHITQCDHCGHEVQAYNSCRHRSCPKCHGTTQATWLAARERSGELRAPANDLDRGLHRAAVLVAEDHDALHAEVHDGEFEGPDHERVVAAVARRGSGLRACGLPGRDFRPEPHAGG